MPDRVSPEVILNRGLPVLVCHLDEFGEPVIDAVTAAPTMRTRHVRFTTASFMAIESHWGSFEGFQEAFKRAKATALAEILHMAWSVGPKADKSLTLEDVCAMLDLRQFARYEVAVMYALQVANGVDPTIASASWSAALDALATKEAMEGKIMTKVAEEIIRATGEADTMLDKMLSAFTMADEMASTGRGSSDSGEEPGDPSTSSST